MKRIYAKSAALLLVSALFLGGCGSAQEESNAAKKPASNHEASGFHGEHTTNGDVREETASAKQLPGFLQGKDKAMAVIYAAAGQNKELLENIPCYCGCSESAGHRDNYDCFIHENKESGAVVWDDHGTRCGVCLETASESITLYKSGKSIKEIRDLIDDKYKEGYAAPTPTQMPKG
ncbi:hypothetical protein CVD28_17410 [Bacillus sp. M6-12]|uniref:PCYCGC motif-containing (lipo)protein n=1 Tax=Bacillus sp. M6-12 TaxID=2054166 RepID=UPI000C789E69|nr:PCYCGC motif-containing (lipo)protein [Bacillus sp. M6-12]PLS16255.1 hypothetical protein CVD28_17410 [Bacillus sp. M6-12]